MGAYQYTALGPEGREKKGLLEGESARQVRQRLREQGLTPLAVEEAAGRDRGESGRGGSRRGISATDLAVATRQLATLVASGLPLEEALRTVARQVERPRVQGVLMAVRARVVEGQSLAAGLADFPRVFPDLYRATVAAGEQSGHLDAVLERLADYTERRQQLRQKVSLALFYPALLTLVAVVVVLALLTYVVPEVVQVFANIGQELPWLTRALIAVSDFLRAYGVVLLLALALAGVAFAALLRRHGFRYRFHALLLRLPVLSRLLRGANTARFARTLHILAASGVPILEALRIAAQVMGNLPMRAAVEEAAGRVREGSGIGRALEPSGQFPPMTLQLIASGEQSGRLDEMLERAADHQERELETLVAALMGLLEPLLIVVMGGVVMVIVLAILLPIFELNQLVQ